MPKEYNHIRFSKFEEVTVLTFYFSFNGYESDQCIVYDINKPMKWACNNSYLVRKAGRIQKLIFKLIKQRGKE